MNSWHKMHCALFLYMHVSPKALLLVCLPAFFFCLLLHCQLKLPEQRNWPLSFLIGKREQAKGSPPPVTIIQCHVSRYCAELPTPNPKR